MAHLYILAIRMHGAGSVNQLYIYIYINYAIRYDMYVKVIIIQSMHAAGMWACSSVCT